MKIHHLLLALTALAASSCTDCPTKAPQPIVIKIMLVDHLDGLPDLVLPMHSKPPSGDLIMPPIPTRTR